LYNETVKLISLYKKAGLTIPFSLKGNLGEFIFFKSCFERYPDARIDYRGGAYLGIDISINNVRIQIKTQVKHQRKIYKNGYLDYEACPTVRKKTLDNKKFDAIVLFIIHPNDSFTEILNYYFYVFTENDFSKFDTKFCISGNKGDYKIMNVIESSGQLSPGMDKIVAHYNTKEYKRLFKTSLNNWNKLDALV